MSETKTKLAIPAEWFTKRWVCWAVRSGYHNSSHCHREDPHDGWGCGWRYEISFPESDWRWLMGETDA